MRKGDIQLDWIVAFFIFIIFLSWSFQFYMHLFTSRSVPLDEVALSINSIVITNITRNVYETPVSYDSPLQQTGAVMYAYYYWNSGGETNTTMVFGSNSAKMPCIISGNLIYWQSDVAAGQNNFTIRVGNRTAAVRNCTGTFSTDNANETIPWSGDLKLMLSQAAIDAMTGTAYQDFKAENSINRDFRLSIEDGQGGTTNYGSVPSNRSNVFSDEKRFKVEETDALMKVTTLVW